VPGPPVIVLGVRRSGTTLLRVMLDRNPELAIPDESYFVPQLAARHRGRIVLEAFVDDLRRLPTLAEWNVDPEAVRSRLRSGMAVGEAIAAVFETYADQHGGKRRWGDKTPLYMQHLSLLERLFPEARFVHLIRDGRNACLSYLAVAPGIMTESWAHPHDAAGFACQWRTEVRGARALGRRVGPERCLEVRYESLVAEPEATLGAVCAFADLSYDPAMLDFPGNVDVATKPHQTSLTRAPTPGLREWRSEMTDRDVEAFEAIAGDLLDELGYELGKPPRARPGPRATAALAAYRARTGAWDTAGRLVQRSPLWRRRHPYVW
jgi:sulfotransferase family protein